MSVNILQWIEDNKKDFLPPVCNKLLYRDQLKVMCIGGSNVRSDYHLEEGEELFYQFKGEMCVKIMEQGKPKDVRIKEGEIFVLPSYIPHSPQRPPGTIGLVIERERLEKEMDGLRFYTNENNEEVLFERWFHCTDLGTQLKPVIDEFFASEAKKTGKPTDNSVQSAAFDIDTEIKVEDPQPLSQLLDKLDGDGKLALFDKGEFKVIAYGSVDTPNTTRDIETFLWQQEGTSTVTFNGNDTTLNANDVMIVPPNTEFSVKREKGCVSLEIMMDPKENPHHKK